MTVVALEMEATGELCDAALALLNQQGPGVGDEHGPARAAMGANSGFIVSPAVASPRRRFARCPGCLRALRDGAVCTACTVAVAAPAVNASARITIAEDRAKRRLHRISQPSTVNAILVNDERVRQLENTAFGVRDRGAHADAVAADVNALADATIGFGHAENRIIMDHIIDSYFSISSQGASRFIEDIKTDTVVTYLVPEDPAEFYSSYASQNSDEHRMVMMPGGYYSDFLIRCDARVLFSRTSVGTSCLAELGLGT